MNNQHLNYAIGHHFAHELTHQMIAITLGYFKEYGLNSYSPVEQINEPNLDKFYLGSTSGHTNDQLNLLLEGAYFDNHPINTCNFISNEQKSNLQNFLAKIGGWACQMKYLCPNRITQDYQQMEQISPGHKALFTYLKIMRNLLETYPDKTSCEIVCGSKILVNTIRMMKLEEYDGF